MAEMRRQGIGGRQHERRCNRGDDAKTCVLHVTSYTAGVKETSCLVNAGASTG